jgi:hypothetical protein
MLPKYEQLQKAITELPYLFDNIELSDEQKKELLKCIFRYYNIEFKLFIINNINLIEINDKVINCILDNGLYEVYKTFVESDKLVPIDEHLIKACGATSKSSESSELVEFIISHKIIPTQKCLNELIIGPLVQNILNQKILDLILDVGIPLTKGDIENIIDGNLNIINFDYIDLIDDDIFNLCVMRKNYLTILSKYEPSINSIRYMFKETYIKNIPDYVLKNINNCDVICLKNALKLRSNLASVKFILSKNITFDHETIKKIVENMCDEKIKTYILDNVKFK